METELKICPFCGARPNPPSFSLDQSGKYGAAQCTDCLALGPEVRAPYGTTDWMGIAAGEWNRRAAPEPAPGDRERAGFWATKDCPACGGRGETYPLCPSCADSTEDHECPDPVKCKVCDERGEIVDTQLRDRLAAEFAAVRAEERERCEKVLSRQLEYIEAARALQRKLNGIFPNHRPLYHANGGLCREADYHKELKDLNHALDEVAAAIRKGEP